MPHYLNYKTTNLVNGKFYLGVHITENLNDGYLGSGKRLKLAIKKYGKWNFRREILHISTTKEAMLTFERLVVDVANTTNIQCYNLVLGGGMPPPATFA